MSAIELDKIGKCYKDIWVLRDVSLKFDYGRIYGITGRNGSGKTMIMRMIAGLVRPSEGTVCVEGKIVGKDVEIPDSLGAIIDMPGFLPDISGYRNLYYLASINKKIGKEEVRAAMQRLGLDPDNRKRVGKYSLGMRQRLGIAQAIMEDPRILLLDEPMNGLDEKGVEDVYALLKELRDKGTCIVLTSHRSEDIENLCDVVYELADGKYVGERKISNRE